MAKKKAEKDLDLGIEQEKGSNKKLIILLVTGVLLLLGGGLGAGWFLFGGAQSESVADDSSAPPEEEKPPAIYQPLDPVFVVNLPPGGDLKMLQIGVQVMVRDPSLIEFIQHNDPMIRNRLLDLFGSQDGGSLQVRKGKEKLQKEVLKSLNKMVKDEGGSGAIEAVYFTAFVMQ